MKTKNLILQVVIIFLIIFFVIFAMSRYINLPSADLGRHIKNGELILKSIIDRSFEAPLHKNYYSYTYPEFKVNNHHWLTGVIHYCIYSLGGFKTLSIFNITCVILANLFFFLCARQFASTSLSLLFVTIALPLTAWRNEVRPEQISYLLLGILILILILSDKQKIKTSLASLMIFFIMLFWVNLHIFFGMGLFTIGCFYLGKALEQNSNNYKQKLLNPFLILGLAGLAGALINPNGISGLLQPLTIFQNFGYQLAENQSVFFMHKRFPFGVIYYYYDLLACLSLFASILFITKNHQKLSSLELSLFVLSAVFMILGFNTTRSMPNFAFVSIPLLSIALGKKLNNSPVKTLITSLVILLVFFGFYYQFYKKEICLGIARGLENSAKFFLENKIQGPIFNNYDIGGYLIFYLYPEHKVFVDNRPEAYPKEFFSKIYEPMQADENKWQEIDKQYNFNAIFFMRQDMTQHAQPFLIRRVRDPNWVVVFVDDSNIILVKNNLLNQELIKRYGLPASMFKAVKQ